MQRNEVEALGPENNGKGKGFDRFINVISVSGRSQEFIVKVEVLTGLLKGWKALRESSFVKIVNSTSARM